MTISYDNLRPSGENGVSYHCASQGYNDTICHLDGVLSGNVMRKYSQKMSGEKSKISKANIDNNKK